MTFLLITVPNWIWENLVYPVLNFFWQYFFYPILNFIWNSLILNFWQTLSDVLWWIWNNTVVWVIQTIIMPLINWTFVRFLVAPWEYFWWAFEIAASLAYLEVIKFL